MRHLVLDLDVDFDGKVLRGTAVLHLDRLDPAAAEVRLDTRALVVASAESADGDGPWAASPFVLESPDPILGAGLSIALPPRADRVRYFAAPKCRRSGGGWSLRVGRSLPSMPTM